MPEDATTQPYFIAIPLSEEEMEEHYAQTKERYEKLMGTIPQEFLLTDINSELQPPRNTFLELTRMVFPYLGDPPPEGISLRYVPELNVLFDALGLHESSSKPAGYRYDMYIDGAYFPFYSEIPLSQKKLEEQYNSFEEGMAENKDLEVQKNIRQQDDCAATALTSQPTSAPTSRPVESQPASQPVEYPATAPVSSIFGENDFIESPSNLESILQSVTTQPAINKEDYAPERETDYQVKLLPAGLALAGIIGMIVVGRYFGKGRFRK
ncbi:MAG: hypothetical protein KJ600_02310 [Nanoarchaeota archaeon]|nr:hypothetical protein [Nanoarchaeota archaeon]MBU1103368.1 hypothetical protein [Nanoarchaeota archaeon]